VPELGGTLVIVPCGLAKIWDKRLDAGPTPARDAYIGAPFVVNREYAERFGDRWVVLSAKYGFIGPDVVVPGPYNVTFKQRSTNPVTVDVLRGQVAELGLDRYDVLALGGAEYRQAVTAAFTGTTMSVRFPFAGMSLGVAMGAAKRAIRSGAPLGP
jgi:hypothetical protein